MISQLFKKSIFAAIVTACALQASDSDYDRAHHHHHHNSGSRTRMVQVVVNPAAQGFQFQINNGVVVPGTGTIVTATNLVSTTNGGLIRPITLNPGGNTLLAGLIFPADTVNPSQASFAVSKNGIPLTQQNSIGNFVQVAEILTPTTFTTTPVNGNTFPTMGTAAQDVQWTFSFNNNNCCLQGNSNNSSRINTLVAFGILNAGTFGSNQVAFTGQNMPAIQASANSNGTNAITSAQVFFSQDIANPQMLINVEFQDPIRI